MFSLTVIKPGQTTIDPTILSPTNHDLSVLDVDAVRAVTRLIDKGFEAYLVGGCVRDLLLNRTPKDYDIATEARPPQVKRTFPRNSRIIGRRFKLAHLHFHGNTKILECSTFRRTPQERPQEGANGEDADLLITRDNEFGTAEEDALRRDFTINALFLDPTRDLIVDHVHGLEDIDARVIRTIGDPVVRFREDPVRILRAAKFAGRLGFDIEKKTLAAMGETAEDLVRAAPPRVLEEILRLLRSGHARSSFELLRDVGAIKHLIPVVGQFLNDATDQQLSSFWTLIDALDQRVQAQPPGREPPANGLLLAVLMFGAVELERDRLPSRSASSVAEKLLGSLAIDLRLPRRDSGCLKRICGVQHRFAQPEEKRRFRVDSFVHSPYFEECLQMFALRTAAENGDREIVEQWYALAEDSHPAMDQGDHPTTDPDVEVNEDSNEANTPPKNRRRRRRRSAPDDNKADLASATNDAAAEQADDDNANPADHIQQPDPTDAPQSSDAKAPVKKKAPRRPRKKVQASHVESDDLSDVTFPAPEEPSTEKASSDSGPRQERNRVESTEARGRSRHREDNQRVDDRREDDRREDNRREDNRREDNRREDNRREDNRREDNRREDNRREDNRRKDEGDGQAHPDGEVTDRKRRRRGRRGRGRDRQQDDGQAEGTTNSDQGQGGDRAASRSSKVKAKKANQETQRKREPRRDGRRGRKPSKTGGSRDVDVVPRYRDRRGKVEVIEPVSLDLSAFDVELDPKRVPTFGSIVEGKGRPKRRGPRLPDRASDEYRPPPPPSSDGTRSDAPKPAPPAEGPDTFGDW